MISERTYLYYAEDDFQYLDEDYQNGRVANYMAYMAQNVCERYLKHIINEYADISNDIEERKQKDFLRKNSLYALITYIQENTDLAITSSEEEIILKADGYLINTMYPSSENINIDRILLDECMAAVYKCREIVLSFCQAND